MNNSNPKMKEFVINSAKVKIRKSQISKFFFFKVIKSVNLNEKGGCPLISQHQKRNFF